MLNLIQDLSPVQLYGKLKLWMDAYELFLDECNSVLFGWLNVQCLSISPEEFHVLALLGIVSAAKARVKVRAERSRLKDEGLHIYTVYSPAKAELKIFLKIWGIFAFIPALLFPDRFGLVYPILALMAYGVPVLTTGIYDEPSPRETWKELLVILTATTLVVVLNYAFFRPYGS